jgi:AMP deaminase
MAEYRISIYGRKKSEWDQMASWIVNNELYSENVVWLIQVDTPIPFFGSVCSVKICKTLASPQWNKSIIFVLYYLFHFSLQIPRIYNVYREMGTINSFQNLLDNIFLPLYEVTVDPASHPQLHVFLEQVSGNTCMFHPMGGFHLIFVVFC